MRRLGFVFVSMLLIVGCGDDSSPGMDGGDDRDADGFDGGGVDGGGVDGGGVDGGGVDGGGVDGGGVDGGGGTEFTMFEYESLPTPCCDFELNIEVASDGTERIFAHEQSGSTRSMYYVVRNGDTWEATNVTEDGSFPRPFSERNAFALDADDDPHGIFSTGSPGRLHYLWLDGTWQSVEIGDSAVGIQFTHFGIDTDAAGNAHVVWFDSATLSLRYGAFNGTDFDIEEVDPPAVDDQNGEFARIAIAGDGTIHISYLAIVSDEPVLRHASGSAGSWTIEDVAGEGKGVHGTMLIDSSGNPIIVSTGLVASRADGLYANVYDGSTWTETMLADPAMYRFADVDADLDSADRVWAIGARSISGLGYPVLFYPLGAEREDFQVRDGPVGDVPESVGLALDDADMPHIVAHTYASLM